MQEIKVAALICLRHVLRKQRAVTTAKFLRRGLPFGAAFGQLRVADFQLQFARGDIDAFVIWQPFGWRAQAAVKDAQILASAKGYFHEWEAVTTTKEYAATHERELLAFLRGLDAAGKWIPKNLDEAAKIVAAQIRLDEVKIARDILEKIDWNIAYSAKFRRDMDVVGDFINAKVNWDAMFDKRFLAKLGAGYVE